MSARPRISIVLPTRERADTLVSALRTCTSQDDPDLEIVVSDNCSQDHTREVVETADDSRIRYVNPKTRLGMSQNWEFGLSQTTGDYVMFLGDDDAVMPEAIDALRTLAQDSGRLDAIAWKDASYQWPEHPRPALRSRLTVPLGDSVRLVRSAAMLDEVINFGRSWHALPWIYRSLVSRAAIDGIIARSGRFFCSQIPDVYSGIAVASIVESYVFSDRPYAVNGASGHSTGTSTFAASHKGPADLFTAEPNIAFHPNLNFTPSGPVIVAESYLQARDNHLPLDDRLDIALVLTESLRQAASLESATYDEVYAAVVRTAERHGLVAEVKSFARTHPNQPRKPAEPVLGHKLVANTVTVDCTSYGIRNVFDAAQLAAHLWTVHDQGVFSMRMTAVALARQIQRALSQPQSALRALRAK